MEEAKEDNPSCSPVTSPRALPPVDTLTASKMRWRPLPLHAIIALVNIVHRVEEKNTRARERVQSRLEKDGQFLS